MVLFPGCYATISGTTVTFHYYTQDYLGNNRAVINGSTGAIEQTIAYYPFGAVIADLGTPTTGQPYKFGGNELRTSKGINEYDFGARNYYSAVPGLTKPDQMAEKYYWLSPYLYCSNNPVNLIDPSGMIWENPEDAENLKKDIDGRIYSYHSWIDILKNFNSDDTSLGGIISELEQRIDNLNTSKSDINLYLKRLNQIK